MLKIAAAKPTDPAVLTTLAALTALTTKSALTGEATVASKTTTYSTAVAAESANAPVATESTTDAAKSTLPGEAASLTAKASTVTGDPALSTLSSLAAKSLITHDPKSADASKALSPDAKGWRRARTNLPLNRSTRKDRVGWNDNIAVNVLRALIPHRNSATNGSAGDLSVNSNSREAQRSSRYQKSFPGSVS